MLGKNIRKLLIDRGMTQNELCSQARISPSVLSKIVNGGDPKLSTLKKIQTALDCSWFELLDGE